MALEVDNKPRRGAYSRSQALDRGIAQLAGRQHGVVARSQLTKLGLTRREIGGRLAAGRLHRMHRGVYAVGHRVVSTRGRWMAAVLACGPTAVLSHRAAAALWGLREAGPLEVTAGRERRHPGIRTSMASVPNDERTIRDGIPVTTVARTLLDLAATLDKRQLKRAIHEAEYRRLTDTVPLDALIARYPGRRGITKIERTTAPRLFRSDLEMDFLEFVDAHELPRPATNVDVEGFECDAVWHDQRLVVELDGGGHDLPTRSEEDRLRDRALTVAGWRVVRVSRLSADLARDLRALLRPA